MLLLTPKEMVLWDLSYIHFFFLNGYMASKEKRIKNYCCHICSQFSIFTLDNTHKMEKDVFIFSLIEIYLEKSHWRISCLIIQLCLKLFLEASPSPWARNAKLERPFSCVSFTSSLSGEETEHRGVKVSSIHQVSLPWLNPTPTVGNPCPTG